MKLTASLLLVGLIGLAVQFSGSARGEGRVLRDVLQQPAENIRTSRAPEALTPERDLLKDPVVTPSESIEGSDSLITTPRRDSNESPRLETTAP